MMVRYEQFENDDERCKIDLWESVRELEAVNKDEAWYFGLVDRDALRLTQDLYDSPKFLRMLIILAKDSETNATLGYAICSIPLRRGKQFHTGRPIDPSVCDLRDAYIAPMARGQKIGTEFVLQIALYALKHGAKTIEVFSHFQSVGFYKRLDFFVPNEIEDTRLELDLTDRTISKYRTMLGKDQIDRSDSRVEKGEDM